MHIGQTQTDVNRNQNIPNMREYENEIKGHTVRNAQQAAECYIGNRNNQGKHLHSIYRGR